MQCVGRLGQHALMQFLAALDTCLRATALLALELLMFSVSNRVVVFSFELCPWQLMLHDLTIHCKWADLGARPPALDVRALQRFPPRRLGSHHGNSAWHTIFRAAMSHSSLVPPSSLPAPLLPPSLPPHRASDLTRLAACSARPLHLTCVF